MGERPGYEDEQYNHVIAGLKSNIQTPVFTSLETLFPFLTKLGFLSKIMLKGLQKRVKNLERAHDYIRSKIEQHRVRIDQSKGDDNQSAQDLVDTYLMEQSRLRVKGEPHTFTDWQLIRVIHEMFIAGTDTTSNSLTWLLLYMTQHPDIQKKVHLEIEEKLGRSRLPTMKDRPLMPYISAVIDEGQRIATIVPMVAHFNYKPDTLGGFYVPARTITMANIYGVHHDAKVWKNPDTFYPEHFLNNKGEYVSNENLIPFSIGKRSCLGESLARMEMFIFFTAFMQRYSVSLCPEDQPNIEHILEGRVGAVRSPNFHQIIFKARE